MLPNSDKWINYLYWGPCVTMFTEVFMTMKIWHFHQSELSLGQYREVTF